MIKARTGKNCRGDNHLRLLSVVTMSFALVNCASSGDPGSGHAANASGVKTLETKLVSLSPSVKRNEAQRTAQCAYTTSLQLADEYRVLGPALFHNFLVNTGIRKRGLCYESTHDLMLQLRILKLKTLELHWGCAYCGTWLEHNCVVVTAKGAPFQQGIILDCWRHSGRLFWRPVTRDYFPWKEDTSEWARTAQSPNFNRRR